jgi:xanthine dehydrogenase accessory factor
MQDIWHKLVVELEAERRVFLALVIESTRGSPGTAASILLVTEAGEQSGTIGGGCMEQGLLELARDILRQDSYAVQVSRLEHRNTSKGNASGLICGGSQTNLLALIDPSHLAVAKKVAEYFRDDRAGVLSISEEGWSFEAGRQSDRIVWMEQAEGWRVHLSTHNRKRIAVFGGGHCGAALAKQMVRLGFSVVLVEPRSDLFTLDDIHEINVIKPDTFAAGAALVDYPEMTHVVVLTPSAKQDINALSGILKHPFPFIGVMGSRAKLNMISESIRDAGFGDEYWQRITAPVGLPIESDTPEEIAVSISAQILGESRRLGFR